MCFCLFFFLVLCFVLFFPSSANEILHYYAKSDKIKEN